MALTRGQILEEMRTDLREFPILQGVGEEGLDSLCQLARCHDYPKGNILHYAGDAASSVVMVIRGKVKVSLTSDEGREVVVDLLRPGSIFGLVAAIDGGTHPANAVTATEARLAKFEPRAFFDWMRRENAMQRMVLLELAARVRQAYQRIGEHALLDVKARLLVTLLEIAGQEGQLGPRGEEVFFTRPTHQELAARIGSSREVVTRVLKELLDSELVSAEGRVIRVPMSALVLRE